MTSAETIRAAIDRLTELRTENDYQSVNGWLVEDIGVGSTYVGGMRIDDGRQPVTNDPLMVTLHTTIEPQLAILRHVLEHYSGDLGISTNRHVVDLARAILSEQADA